MKNTKYPDIMNKNGLTGKIQRMDEETINKLFSLKCEVTEKIDGESFRVGIDECKEFIGQRNNLFYDFDNHPHWKKMSAKLKMEIIKIHSFIRNLRISNKYTEIVFFGELYGNSVQGRFKFPSNELNVVWYDISYDGGTFLSYSEKIHVLNTLDLNTPYLFGIMSLQDALKLDVENIESHLAEDKFIEGVVIKPLDMLKVDWWRFPSRLIFKHKTKRFSEEKRGKHKGEKPINNFVSKFVDFVTKERIHHAIQHLREKNIEIFYEMRDCQHIPSEVIADIEKEENEGHPISKEDRKYLGSYIPRFYQKMLNDEVDKIMK